MRSIALATLLLGCPSSLQSPDLTADCCEPADAGCEWVPLTYRVPRLTEDWQSDEAACRRAGLEPYPEEVR